MSGAVTLVGRSPDLPQSYSLKKLRTMKGSTGKLMHARHPRSFGDCTLPLPRHSTGLSHEKVAYNHIEDQYVAPGQPM